MNTVGQLFLLIAFECYGLLNARERTGVSELPGGLAGVAFPRVACRSGAEGAPRLPRPGGGGCVCLVPFAGDPRPTPGALALPGSPPARRSSGGALPAPQNSPRAPPRPAPPRPPLSAPARAVPRPRSRTSRVALTCGRGRGSSGSGTRWRPPRVRVSGRRGCGAAGRGGPGGAAPRRGAAAAPEGERRGGLPAAGGPGWACRGWRGGGGGGR